MPAIGGSHDFGAHYGEHAHFGTDTSHFFNGPNAPEFGLPGSQDFYGGPHNVGDDRDTSGTAGRPGWQPANQHVLYSTRGIRLIPLVYRHISEHQPALDFVPFLEFGSGAARPGLQLMRDKAWIEFNRALGLFNRGNKLSVQMPLRHSLLAPWGIWARVDIAAGSRSGSYDTRTMDPESLKFVQGFIPANRHTLMFAEIYDPLERLGRRLVPHENLMRKDLIEAPVWRLNDEFVQVPVTDVMSNDNSFEFTLRFLNALVETRFRTGSVDMFQVRRLVTGGAQGTLDSAPINPNGGIDLLPRHSWTWLVEHLRHPERYLPVRTANETSYDPKQLATAAPKGPSRTALRAEVVKAWLNAALFGTDDRTPAAFAPSRAAFDEHRFPQVSMYLGTWSRLLRNVASWPRRLFEQWPSSARGLAHFACLVEAHVRNIFDANCPQIYIAAHEKSFSLALNSLLPRLAKWSWVPLGLPLSDFLSVSVRKVSTWIDNTTFRVAPNVFDLRPDARKHDLIDAPYDTVMQVVLQDELSKVDTRVVQFSQQASSPQVFRNAEASTRTEIEQQVFLMLPKSFEEKLLLRDTLAEVSRHLVLAAPERKKIMGRPGSAQVARELLDDAWQRTDKLNSMLSPRERALFRTEPRALTLIAKSSEASRVLISSPLWHQQVDLRRARQTLSEAETRYVTFIDDSTEISDDSTESAKIDCVQRIIRHRTSHPAIATALDNLKRYELLFESVLLRLGQSGLKHIDYRFEQKLPNPTKADINHLILSINRAFGLDDADSIAPHISMFTSKSAGPLAERTLRFEGKLNRKELLEGRALWLMAEERKLEVMPHAFDQLRDDEIKELSDLFRCGLPVHPAKELTAFDVEAEANMFAGLANYLDTREFEDVLRLVGALAQLCLMGARHYEVQRAQPVAQDAKTERRNKAVFKDYDSEPLYKDFRHEAINTQPVTTGEKEQVRINAPPLFRPGPSPVPRPHFQSESGVYVAVLNRAWPLINSYTQRGSIMPDEDAHSIVMRWTHALPHIEALTLLQKSCALDTHIREGLRVFLLANIGRANVGMMRLLWPPDVLKVLAAVRPFKPEQEARMHSIVAKLAAYGDNVPQMMMPLVFFCGGTQATANKCAALEQDTTTPEASWLRERDAWLRLVERMLATLAPDDAPELCERGLDERLYPWPAPIFGVHIKGKNRFAFCFDPLELGLNPHTGNNLADEIVVECGWHRELRQRTELALDATAHTKRRKWRVHRDPRLELPNLVPGLVADFSEVGRSTGQLDTSLFPLGARRSDFVAQHHELGVLRARLINLRPPAVASPPAQRMAS